MKNVGELLNLLFSTPSEASGLLGGKSAISPKGPQTGNGSFEEVLARTTSQSGNSKAFNPGLTTPEESSSQVQTGQGAVSNHGAVGQTGALTTISETTIAISESVKASNPGQLVQAEQVLASLAVGLAHLINVMSQLNQGQTQQAQAALKTLGLGPEALPAIQSLMNKLQSFFQNLPPQQNPLALPSDQQAALLGQLFQQLLQNQQVLLGAMPAAQTGASDNNQTSAGGTQQAAILQVLFSETQASQIQQGNTQASQVFINLQTFKMSATFVQEGQGSGLQALPSSPQAFLNNLNQALNPPNSSNNAAVTPTGSLLTASSQNDLNQNFRNLVQLLMQSGVSQAALTTFMRHQQETENLNTLSNQTATGSPTSANPVQGTAVEIPPVNPTEQTTESTNDMNAARVRNPAGNILGTQNNNLPLVELAVPNQAAPVSNINAPKIPANASGLENPKGPGLTNSFPTQPETAVNSPVTQAVILPSQETAVLNNTVNRLNAIAAQALIARPGATGENVFGPNRGNAAPAQSQALSNQIENQNGVNAAQAQSTLSPRQPLTEQNGLNPREIAILNDTVVRMNASALHTIEGSIGGNNTTPDMNLTMGQVLSSVSATRLSSSQPPTFGNPSVPLNAPVQSQLVSPLNAAEQKTAGILPEVQTTQNNAATATTPSNTAPEAVVFSGPAVRVSTVLQEPINQAAPQIPQTAANPASVNQVLTLNNGVGTTPGNNNAVIAPPATANISNTAVTTNPGPSPVPTSNAVVPLPQPATLPVGANPSAAQVNNPAGTRAFAPAVLNQIIAPPPTSQAPVIPATAVVGEGVKAEIPATTVPRNENFANPSAVAGAQPLSSVIPVSPEAVAPAGGVLASATGLGTLNVLDKNAPNNGIVLDANTLLGFSNAASLAAGSTHTSSPTAISSAPGGNFNAVNLLGQITQQVSAQAAQANSISHLSFQLMPESLGRITVQVALVDQSVSARIVVTNPDVRDTLQSHMVDLKSALNQAGLHIDQLQVQVQGGGSGNLLAQYYQYQQEGFGYRLPVSPAPSAVEGALNPENMGNLEVSPARMSLVDVLA